MRDYELVLVLTPELTKTKQKAIVDKVKKVVKDGEGTVEKVDEWGKKEFAYPIKKKKEGIYFLLQLKASASSLKELEGNLRIEEQILRYLLVRQD